MKNYKINNLLKYSSLLTYLIVSIYLFFKINLLKDQVNYNIIIYILIIHFCFFLIFFFKKKIIEFFLVNFFIFLTLYAIEGFLFHLDKDKIIVNTQTVVKLRKQAAENKGIKFDDRRAIEVFFEEKEQNNDLRLGFSWMLKSRNEFIEAQKELSTDLIPLSGPMNKLILSANEDGIFKKLYTDKYGFKNTNDRYERKIDNILVGDSFVFSGTYKNEDDISGLLNLKYNLNSLNYGIVGTSFLSHYAVIKEFVVKLKPSQIFLFYYEGNDLPELKLEFKNKFLVDYLNNDSQNLILENELSSRLIDLYQKKRYDTLYKKYIKEKKPQKNILNYNNRYSIFTFIKLQKLRKYLGIHNRTLEDFDLEKFDFVLSKINNLTDEENIEVTFVYLPSWLRYNNYYGYQYKQLAHKNKVIDLANKYFPIIDIAELMKKEPNKYFPVGLYGHFNKDGLALVADVLAAK